MMTRQLASRLAAGEVIYMPARIRHTRLGPLRHAFAYRADYLLFSPEEVRHSRGLLARNRFGLFSVHDRDYGGMRRRGGGAAWVWAQLAVAGISRSNTMTLGLLTQPRMFGLGFNPVNFWLLWQGDALIAMLAEVNNTYGQRHCYLCRNPDLSPITSACALHVSKVFHVSPFQDVAGGYQFRLGLSESRLDILIQHQGPYSGLVARMQGELVPLRQRSLLLSAFARPGGGLRIIGLILFEALRLKIRGARFRPLPSAPNEDVSL